MSELCPIRIEQRLAGHSKVLPAFYEEWWRLRLAFTDMITIIADPWCLEQMRDDAVEGQPGTRQFRDYGDTCVFAGIPIEVSSSSGRTVRWVAERPGSQVQGELW